MAFSLRFVLIVVGSAAYLELAVLGRGGFAAFSSHPPLIALAVVFFLQVGAAFFAGGNISAGVREDRGNRWVLAVFGVIGLRDAFVPAWSDRREVWTFGGDTVRWIGVVLFAVGVRCEYGRCSCWATGSVGLWRSSPGIGLLRVGFIVSFGTSVILGCRSVRSGGVGASVRIGCGACGFVNSAGAGANGAEERLPQFGAECSARGRGG
jgi:hypothetical protein